MIIPSNILNIWRNKLGRFFVSRDESEVKWLFYELDRDYCNELNRMKKAMTSLNKPEYFGKELEEYSAAIETELRCIERNEALLPSDLEELEGYLENMEAIIGALRDYHKEKLEEAEAEKITNDDLHPGVNDASTWVNPNGLKGDNRP